MCAAPIQALPQPSGEYILDTDASNVGDGAPPVTGTRGKGESNCLWI